VLFEGVNNALKLLGDQYLARVYRLVSTRFHLAEWDTSILRKLQTLESIYEKLADTAATRRLEVLEWIIILLTALSLVVYFLPARAVHGATQGGPSDSAKLIPEITWCEWDPQPGSGRAAPGHEIRAVTIERLWRSSTSRETARESTTYAVGKGQSKVKCRFTGARRHASVRGPRPTNMKIGNLNPKRRWTNSENTSDDLWGQTRIIPWWEAPL